MNDGLFLALVSRSSPQKSAQRTLPVEREVELVGALVDRLALHVGGRFERLLADAEAEADDRPPSVT